MPNNDAFVLMPFSESLSEVYDFLIKGSLESVGYIVKRADDIKSQRNILEDIIKEIINSDLIVADLTDSNPNVYYELGIAHALGKNVVLITQEIEELPFDLRSYRVISYGTHFAKMIQAKDELLDIAKNAITGKIPFGNPVKDYAVTKDIPNFNKAESELPEEGEELGILDYKMDMEGSFEELTEIIEEVGSKLSDELTPEINSTTEKFTSKNITTKQQREIVQNLANHMDDYARYLKPRNERYKHLLNKIETSLEYLLSGNIDYQTDEEKENMISFIDTLKSMEQGAFDGRQGFSSMLEVQKHLPKIEKSFNRSNNFMQAQVEQFIENIDQTISVSTRARMLGNALLNKGKRTE